MASRVTINVTAHDLTRGQLQRMRRNFSQLGNDINQLGMNRTQGSFDQLNRTLGDTNSQLEGLRGRIPQDEFDRLETRVRSLQGTMSRGLTGMTDDDIGRLRQNLRSLDEDFTRISRNADVRVRVDDDTGPGLRRVRSRVTGESHGLLSRIGSMIGGTMSDGVGQGLSNGFRNAASNPYVIAALATALAALAAMVGAALSGILVTALGLAFIGIAGFSAAKSAEVKDQWQHTLGVLKEEFADVGKPLIPVLDDALERLERMAKAFGPVFEQAMVEAAPAVDEFITSLQDGFIRFGENAFGPLMDAWEVFGPIFGQEFEDFMGELGDSFKEMAQLVQDHSEEIRLAIRGVFELIDLVVDAVTFLGKVWVFMAQNAGDAFGFIIKYGLRYLVDAVLAAAESIMTKMADAFGWIPGGVGKSLKDAAKSVEGFRDDAWEQFTSISEAAFGVDDALNRLNKERKLKANISSWSAALKKARSDLKKTTDQKAKAKLKADIADLTTKLKKAREDLADLNGKTATTYVNTVYTSTSQGGHPTQRKKATGGIIGAATGGVRSNMTLVGEHGPELVDLAPGSRVLSNSDTRRTLSAQGMGAGVFQINLVVDGRVLATTLFDPTREIIRDKGGVARAYGG